MPDARHYRHELEDALDAFDVRSRWEAADPNEQLAVLNWLESTPPEHRTRRARGVAQWLSADHPLLAKNIERRWRLRVPHAGSDDDHPPAEEPVSDELPAGLEPGEALTLELQKRAASRATWAALDDDDRQRLREYVIGAATPRGQANRAREIRGVLWSGEASVRAWLDFFHSPDGYRAMEGLILKPWSHG